MNRATVLGLLATACGVAPDADPVVRADSAGSERMVVIERDAMDAPRLAAWRIRRP